MKVEMTCLTCGHDIFALHQNGLPEVTTLFDGDSSRLNRCRNLKNPLQ